MSTLNVSTIQSLATATLPVVNDSAGTEYGRFCRAFVNFNGFAPVTIRASFNVSSVSKTGTGQYTVNFTNAMPDANYTVVMNTNLGSSDVAGLAGPLPSTNTSGLTKLATNRSDLDSPAYADCSYVNVSVFR